MSPFVDFGIDVEGFEAAWVLRYDDFGASFVHVVDNPLGIEGLIGDQARECDPLDQRRHTHRIVALAWQEMEANQIAQGIGQSQDLGRQAAP